MNQFTRAVWDRPSCIQGSDLTNSARWLMALVLLTIATLASAVSWDDDSHYVSLGPRSGCYIGSVEQKKLKEGDDVFAVMKATSVSIEKG
jgi:hypothetical protein